jgi:hypothetical protein
MIEAARSSAADHDRVGAVRNGADVEETCTAAEAGVAAVVTAAAAVTAVVVTVTAVTGTVTAVTGTVTAVTKTVPPQRRLVQVLVGKCPGTRLVFICVG